MTSIADVLGQYTVTDPAGLERALLAREDEMRTHLHLAAVQFGLYPFIVAEVLATIGLGSPVTDEERAMIRANYVAGMQQIQQAWHEAHGHEAPAPPPDDVDPRDEAPPAADQPEGEAPEEDPPPDSVDRI